MLRLLGLVSVRRPNPSAFEVLHSLMKDIDKFLEESPENVVAIHCKVKALIFLSTDSNLVPEPSCPKYFGSKPVSLQPRHFPFLQQAGKGRTGMVISTFLLHSHLYEFSVRL